MFEPMKDFKKYYIIPAKPEQIYLALTTETTIRLWTGDEVSIDPVVGGKFSMWDGSIEGEFVELTPYTKIVQEWYFGDQPQPSIVTFKLHDHKKGTSIELVHTNIPEDDFEDIVDGWNAVYMHSLLDFYEGEEW